jgi:hypothetical protein
VELFRIALYLEEIRAGRRAGFARKEDDEDFAGIEVAAGGEGGVGDDVAEFGDGAEEDVRTKTEFSVDGILDAFGEESEIFVLSVEDDVATLDEGLGIFESEGEVEGAKGVHFDFVVAADVDATKHGDNDGHGGMKVFSYKLSVFSERRRRQTIEEGSLVTVPVVDDGGEARGQCGGETSGLSYCAKIRGSRGHRAQHAGPGKAGSLFFDGAVFEEIFEFGHEFLDVFEIHIDTGEADVSDLIELFEAMHDHFADLGGGGLAPGGFVDHTFDFVDDGFEFRRRDRALFAGFEEALEDLLALEALAAAIFLDDHVGNLVDALISGKPPRAFEAFTAAADGVAGTALAGINYFVIEMRAERALHSEASPGASVASRK